MLVGQRLGLMARQPPRRIMHQLVGSRSAVLATAGHFAFGSGCGAAFAVIPKPRAVPPYVSGAVFGLGVWALGYAAVLPALGILAPPEDTPKRAATMIPAHLVYGITLGPALRVKPR